MKNRLEQEKEFQDNRVIHKEEKRFIIGYKKLMNDFSKKLYRLHDKNILALGCGTGNYELKLAETNQINAIDISPESIKALNKKIKERKLSKKAKAMLMDAENLKFKDDSLDAVYGVAILHHLDLKKVMQELKRITKPNSRLYFIEPPISNFRVRKYRRKTPHMRSKFEHPLTRKDLKLIKKYFRVKIKGYYFLQTFMPKFIRHKEKYGKIRKLLDNLDSIILEISPFLNIYCYSIIIELRN